MSTIRAVIQDRRINVPAPDDLPDGAEVIVQVSTEDNNDGPMSPEEIERTLAAMRQLLPLDIPAEVAADLDAWEEKINQHGINGSEKGIESVFR